ncbi:uncharacterized protein N7496_009331 [Penicillium cataractarum]|uniref:Rhodopsin domain-containing protein n=1 Tax=Penicillium cataractarum TaxID=2100454 RepID=A0A9W9RNT2_9EURO|nr:uncharacterized protein N7496_009331 [Penicillium cataractarum]KAJ5363618.1 hypothetical protein N7496_009331 [Penicillium cataractarum]
MSPPVGTLVHELGRNWLGKADIAVQTILLAFGFVVVGLRLWSRRLQGTSWQGSDWMIVAATIFMVGRYSVELVLILLCGMGLHTDEVASIGGPDLFVQFDQLTYAGDILWITIVALIQLSILHYYLRRFPHRIIMWPTYITMGLCTALWIASTFATAFFCTPPKKIWLSDVQGHCGNRKMLHLGSSVSEMILHGVILLLPIPVTRDMILSRARKVALGCIYFLGIVIIVISAVRIKVEFDLDPEDPTYGSARKSLFTSVVPLLGIIAACLPILPPAIQRVFGASLFSSTADGIATSPVSSGYWKTTVLSKRQMEELEIPLVTVTMPPMAKKLSELAHGQIKITSDWEIHSARNSARLERDSIRRA